MPLLLNVPAEEEHEAKALGAEWCKELGKWYVLERENYARFARWTDGNVVICDHIYIVEGIRTCYACGMQTKVIGFGFEKIFDIHDSNPSLDECNIHIGNIYSPLPKSLVQRLKEQYNF